MSRLALLIVVLLLAIVVAPEARAVAFNSADVIVILSPLALVAIVAWPRRHRRARPPSPWLEHRDPTDGRDH